MFALFGQLWLFVQSLWRREHRKWKRRTLVIGPAQPVDGDSVACTRALVEHLRKLGLEAYTLPVLSMFDQLSWILEPGLLHPSCLSLADAQLVTRDMQAAYDELLKIWRPDEIVYVDGSPSQLFLDTCGVPLYRIDHHLKPGEQAQDDEHGCVMKAPATGCVLVEKFGIYDPILAVSILTDTFWLRMNMPAKAIESLAMLHARGGLTDELLEEIQRKLRPLKSVEILFEMRRCQMHVVGESVFAVLTTADPELHREIVGVYGYYFRHICVVRADGYVSLRSQTIDMRPLASKHGGGGHAQMAAIPLTTVDATTLAALQSDFNITITQAS